MTPQERRARLGRPCPCVRQLRACEVIDREPIVPPEPEPVVPSAPREPGMRRKTQPASMMMVAMLAGIAALGGMPPRRDF